MADDMLKRTSQRLTGGAGKKKPPEEKTRLERLRDLALKAIKLFRRARRIYIAIVVAVKAVIAFIAATWPALLAMLAVAAAIVVVVSIANVAMDFLGLGGADRPSIEEVERILDENPALKKALTTDEIEDSVAIQLDCSNKSPAEARPNENCIPGLLAKIEAERAGPDQPGPVPQRAEWMVPVWQAAAERYQVDWIALAAIQGARSYFGLRNCEDSRFGSGTYRILPDNWDVYAFDGGSVYKEPASPGCYQVVSFEEISAVEKPKTDDQRKSLSDKYKPSIVKVGPVKKLSDDPIRPYVSGPGGGSKVGPGSEIFRESPLYDPNPTVNDLGPFRPTGSGARTPISRLGSSTADIYDPIDASFTEARIIAHQGAFARKEWKYSGSGPGQCSALETDGQVWYYADFAPVGAAGAGAQFGFNSKLNVSPRAIQLAAKYRSNKGKYQPRRDHWAIDDRLGYHPIPKRDIVFLLTSAWTAFGKRGAELHRNVTLNYAQIGLESGGRPYLMQGIIGDENDDNPAGGLMQFIPSTFDHWKVDGFNDRFNPIDNILATVNAQVNGPNPILDGSSGWSPPFSTNPYASGGRARNLAPKPKPKPKEAGDSADDYNPLPYKGREIKDPVSRAIKYRSTAGPHSDCYVAVVNAWYDAIKKNPPESSFSLGGPVRDRIVKIAQAELAKNPEENGADNYPRYEGGSGKIAPYAISGAPWCQAFASHIWYWAGIRKIWEPLAGMTTESGLKLPSYTCTMVEWGKANNAYKTKNPLPGDMIFLDCDHVEIVEKVRDGRVISTIGGNTSDAVSRQLGFTGSSEFVEPPGADIASDYAAGGQATPLRGKLNRQFAALLNQLDVEASVVYTSGSKSSSLGNVASAKAWSTIKVPIVTAYLRGLGKKPVPADAAADIAAAIRESDNSAIERIWARLARSEKSRFDRLERTLRAGGDVSEVSRSAGGSGFSAYGQTNWSGSAANNWYLSLARGKLLPPKKTALVINHMSNISQSWGTPAAGFTTAKPGWGPEGSRGGRYVLRETGLKGKRAALTIIVVAGDSYESGQGPATKIAEWVKRNEAKLK